MGAEQQSLRNRQRHRLSRAASFPVRGDRYDMAHDGKQAELDCLDKGQSIKDWLCRRWWESCNFSAFIRKVISTCVANNSMSRYVVLINPCWVVDAVGLNPVQRKHKLLGG